MVQLIDGPTNFVETRPFCLPQTAYVRFVSTRLTLRSGEGVYKRETLVWGRTGNFSMIHLVAPDALC